MSELTDHGRLVAEQIQDYDAYGRKGVLTFADIWFILDNIHTQYCDEELDTSFLEKWMMELEDKDGDLPL